MLRTRRYLVAIFALLCMSCLAPQSAEMVAIDGREWSQSAQIEIENSDTMSLRNISVAVRTNSRFKDSTLPVKIEVLTPDGRIFSEECSFATTSAEGAKIVSQSVALPYRNDVVLSIKGRYIFVLTPLVPTKGIEAVGVVISDVKECNNGKR